jgi:serine/threonine protein kinase
VDSSPLTHTAARTLMAEKSALGRLEPLGKGGTAIVYRAPDFKVPGVGSVVYKEYKQSTRTHAGPALQAGLLAFVRFREKLAPELRRLWDERIVWPLRVVSEDGAATGVVMPLIPGRFFQHITSRSGQTSTKPREVDALFGRTEDMTRIGFDAVDGHTRIALLAQIAATYAMMHRAGVVVGDISGRNLVYDPAAPRPTVLVVDADSSRVAGTRSAFSSQPHTPYWEPPEALLASRQLKYARKTGGSATGEIARLSNVTTVQNRATDVYKFGLLVIRGLDHGRGRSISRDTTRAGRLLRRAFGPEAVTLLDRTLGDDPARRPSIRDWYDLFHHGNAGRRRPDGHGGATAREGAATAPAISDGQVTGGWVFIEGQGWVRRSAAGGSN